MKIVFRIIGLLSICLISSVTWISAKQVDFDEELERFDFDIEIRSVKKLNSQFTPSDFANTLKITKPLFLTKYTREQVRLMIENEVQKLVTKKFPKERYDEIEIEAEKRYTMYKVGDNIVIHRQYGGQLLEASGLLETVATELVKVSGLPIPTVDIVSEDLARLYWRQHEEAISKYIRNKTREFEDARKAYRQKIRAKIARTMWHQSGYRKIKRSNRWVSVLNAFLNQFERTKREMLESIRIPERVEVYKENGYSYVEERGGWILQSVLDEEQRALEEGGDSILGKIKVFFKKKKSAESTQVVEDEEDQKDSIPADLEEEFWEESNKDASAAESNEIDDKSGKGEKPLQNTDSPEETDGASDLFDEED